MKKIWYIVVVAMSVIIFILVQAMSLAQTQKVTDTEERILQGNFNGHQHIGIPVSDIKQSIDFYTKLGFDNVMSRTSDDGSRITVAMMKRENVIMELYPGRTAESSGPINHVAFDVNDINKAFEELKAAGLTSPNQKAPRTLANFWENGCSFFSIRGPDCETLEFNQIL